MRSRLIPLTVLAMLLGACGPNTLTARGKVMHPLMKAEDTNEVAFVRVVTIVRKEPDLQHHHRIAGQYGTPMAMGELQEPAEIPEHIFKGDVLHGIMITVELYSPYKEELVREGIQQYAFTLVLPDGRRVPGKIDRAWQLRDFTQIVSGGAMRTHGVVRNRQSGSTTPIRGWTPVDNHHELYWRKLRIEFRAKDLITLDTDHIIFEVLGHRRLRRYRFDFATSELEILETEKRR